MMNTYMKLLLVSIVAVSGHPAWAQTDAATDAMPEMDHRTMDHGTMEQGAMPAMDHSTMDHGTMEQGAMPAMDHSTMDHSKMTHGAMPDTAVAQPNMNHDMSGSDEEMQGMEHGDMNMQGGSAPPDARVLICT